MDYSEDPEPHNPQADDWRELAERYKRDRDKIVEILDDAGLPRAHDKGQHTLPARVKMLAEDQAFDAKYREKYRGELETVKAALARAVDLIGRVEMSPLLQEEADAIATDPMSASALMEWRTLSVERDEARAKLAKAEEENARLRNELDVPLRNAVAAHEELERERQMHRRVLEAADKVNQRNEAALGRAVAALRDVSPYVELPIEKVVIGDTMRAILDDPTWAAAGEYVRALEAVYEASETAHPLMGGGSGFYDAHAVLGLALVKVRKRRGAK